MIDRRAIGVAVATAASFVLLSQVGTSPVAPSSAGAAARTVASCSPTWTTVPSPSLLNTHGLFNWNALLAASATSSTDAWAVGEDANATVYTAIGRAVAMHWDGSSWTFVPPVNPAGGNTYLSGVISLSPKKVYAVGSDRSNKIRSGLIEEYDGSKWVVSPMPQIGSSTVLYSIAATGSHDIWTVGEYIGSTSRTESLVLHSDGTGFVQVPSDRTVAGTNRLYGAAAISPTDAWSVGVEEQAGPAQTLTEHWDGSAWTRIPSPSISSKRSNVLTSVSAASTSDVWAVGEYTQTDGTLRPLIEHWDGSTWTVTPSPTPGITTARLFNVLALSPTDAWAVGTFYLGDTLNGKNQAFGMHWNGRAWAVVDMSGGVTTPPTHLYGLAKTKNGELWAVGRSDLLTLTEHYGAGCQARPVALAPEQPTSATSWRR